MLPKNKIKLYSLRKTSLVSYLGGPNSYLCISHKIIKIQKFLLFDWIMKNEERRKCERAFYETETAEIMLQKTQILFYDKKGGREKADIPYFVDVKQWKKSSDKFLNGN